jgi:hypothetical protein
MSEKTTIHYSDLEPFHDEVDSSTADHKEKGWSWGKRTRPLPPLPVTTRDEQLDIYLAESRTTYTPLEGEQMMEETGGGLQKKLSHIYSSLSARSKRNRLAYNVSMASKKSWNEHGLLEDEESVYSPQDPEAQQTPPRTFGSAFGSTFWLHSRGRS